VQTTRFVVVVHCPFTHVVEVEIDVEEALVVPTANAGCCSVTGVLAATTGNVLRLPSDQRITSPTTSAGIPCGTGSVLHMMDCVSVQPRAS
jgi:hypothetical protein